MNVKFVIEENMLIKLDLIVQLIVKHVKKENTVY